MARVAAIEAKGKFIQIGVHIRGGHCPLVGAEQPALEERSNAMNVRQQNVRRIAADGNVDLLVHVSLLRKAVVTPLSVGPSLCARFNHRHNQRNRLAPDTSLTLILPLQNVSLSELFYCERVAKMTKSKMKRVQYTLEFKQEAARLVESGQSQAAVSRSPGVVEQTLGNWVRSNRARNLKGATSKPQVTAEQMEVSRLRAELAHVTMERDISGKATAYCVLRKRPL